MNPKVFIKLILFLSIIASACNINKRSMDISNVFKDYYEERLMHNPLEATMAGDERYNHILKNDLTESYKKELKSFFQKHLEVLNLINKDELSEKDQLSYELMNWECSMNLEGLQFHTELIPINQFESMHLLIGQLAGGSSIQPFKTVKDYENWLMRVDGFIDWCDTAIVNMRQGIKGGYTLPKILATKVIPQLQALSHGPVKDHVFYRPILSMPSDFSASEKERLEKAYQEKIEGKVIPAFKMLYDFFENEYLSHCRETAGMSGIPQGREFYEYKVRYYTTTNLTPDQIFEIGEKEVTRITAEMEKVKQQVGYKGDLISFFNFVRSNKQLMPYKNADEVIAHFKTIRKTIEPHLKALFDLVPKSPFEIKRTEAFREKTASAEYMPGSWDGTRPGIFYVPVPDASEYNVYADEDLFLHEAIPGHHYQISIQQEDSTLPKFRRGCWFTAYGEGWALYTESLGKDLGLYTDPYQYFGMLSMEMHRSIRLVVDVGIHYKNWTREQAIKYSMDHEAEPEDMIISEIERYMAYPAQALSYKIGQLKILELRAKAEKILGVKFDIRQFHNKVLESGCLPLVVLEEKINNWMHP